MPRGICMFVDRRLDDKGWGWTYFAQRRPTPDFSLYSFFACIAVSLLIFLLLP